MPRKTFGACDVFCGTARLQIWMAGYKWMGDWRIWWGWGPCFFLGGVGGFVFLVFFFLSNSNHTLLFFFWWSWTKQQKSGWWNRHEDRLFFCGINIIFTNQWEFDDVTWLLEKTCFYFFDIPRESPLRDSCGSWSVATFTSRGLLPFMENPVLTLSI